MAGLRTNALVALGAAAFVVFSQLVPNDASPTRVAAQVVSGIGFLGAGIIFRDGANIHGLNTAATLWCSAAVGVLAGISAWPFAAILTGFVVFVNLGLRPLVRWIKRQAPGTAGGSARLTLTCKPEHEPAMRAVLLKAVAGMQLVEITSQTSESGIMLTAHIAQDEHSPEAIHALHSIAATAGVSRAYFAYNGEI
jgi:putative Mg2+ transporter-C (MgtC) family protein